MFVFWEQELSITNAVVEINHQLRIKKRSSKSLHGLLLAYNEIDSYYDEVITQDAVCMHVFEGKHSIMTYSQSILVRNEHTYMVQQ